MSLDSVVACIFSENQKKILLIKRRDVPVWVLPGGGIEKKETPEAAILREVKEETGYDVIISRKIGEYTPITKLAKFTHLFECSIISGNARINEETKEIQFFSIHQLPKRLPPPYREWILDGTKKYPFLMQKKLTSITYLTLCKYLLLHPILVGRFLLTKIGFTINS